MDFDTVRPIISGVIGATIAGWLAVKWAKRLPHAKNQAKQRKLARDQKGVILAANVGAGIALATGLILYLGGILDNRDWRGLGLMMGLMAFLPSLVIVICNLQGGARQIRDGFMAYSLAQKIPPFLLFSLMILMFCGGLWATYAFIPKQKAERGGQPATPLRVWRLNLNENLYSFLTSLRFPIWAGREEVWRQLNAKRGQNKDVDPNA